MPSDLFSRLDEDWERVARGHDADTVLATWAGAEPALTGFTSFDRLLAALRGRVDASWRDRRMLALLRLAQFDLTARRVALQVVRPALSCLAYTYTPRWGAEDAGSEVIATALQRIATYPTDRRLTNVAGQIVQDIRHSLFKRLQRELAAEEVFAVMEDVSLLERELVAGPELTAADQLASIIEGAVRSGRITERHAQLVVDTRLRGIPIDDVANSWGRPAQTVRRMRQRVERALVGVAVA